jgi:hypothetical protein
MLPLRFVPTSEPVTTARYGESVVSRMWNGALEDGWSSHGNQLAAPLGWLATRTPSVSSSQPTSPQAPRMGRGLPE